MASNVIHPKPPQWERRPENPEVLNDEVLSLVNRLMECIHAGRELDLVVLASIRMVQKAIIMNYQRNAGKEATMEALRQATTLAAQYTIGGVGVDDAQ
jgi:hypothetical protein